MAAWSVDRLGRSLTDLLVFLGGVMLGRLPLLSGLAETVAIGVADSRYVRSAVDPTHDFSLAHSAGRAAGCRREIEGGKNLQPFAVRQVFAFGSQASNRYAGLAFSSWKLNRTPVGASSQ
jgi:hypothetical protein